MKTPAGILALVTLLGVAGCHTEKVVYIDEQPPTRPTGVTSVTADGAVYLFWDPNGEPDLDYYRVYRGFSATGNFDFIGSTGEESYVDLQVVNGETYYYAVSAVDRAGLESGLSVENVHDTPRPEGYDVILYDLAANPAVSGFDFSRQRRVAFDDPLADVFVDRDASLGVLFLNAANLSTALQDMGYTQSLDDITWSPTDGWSPVGWTQLIAGHTYVVWTDNDHYAKLRAVEVAETWARFDWAYQVDPGNPELVKPAHDSGYVRRFPAPQPGHDLKPAN
jgi:hypothetical protein